MGKNKLGGKNFKKRKDVTESTSELLFKEDEQDYAQVTKMLGSGRLEALCLDGEKRLCIIRGKMLKKVWVTVGDVILISLRSYQDKKADVIHKYTPEEVRLLKIYNELPENSVIQLSSKPSDLPTTEIVFDEDDIDDI